MTDRPIIFSAPMVRALLDNRKSQTRRILKPQPPEWVSAVCHDAGREWIGSGDGHGTILRSPFAPGDRLWVREAHYLTDDGDEERVVYAEDQGAVAAHLAGVTNMQRQYNLSDAWAKPHLQLRSSIHMPRWASRLTLIVTDVRVQRLQEISEADAIAEGFRPYANSLTIDCDTPPPSGDFRSLWNSIHGPDAWGANPWVVALTFAVHHCNIGDMTT